MNAIPGCKEPAIDCIEQPAEAEPRLGVDSPNALDRALDEDRRNERLIELEADEALVVESEQVMQEGRSRTRRGDNEYRSGHGRVFERGIKDGIEPARDRYATVQERMGERETARIEASSQRQAAGTRTTTSEPCDGLGVNVHGLPSLACNCACCVVVDQYPWGMHGSGTVTRPASRQPR